jgi:hypothetical protein
MVANHNKHILVTISLKKETYNVKSDIVKEVID